jgi:hypothetical protein
MNSRQTRRSRFMSTISSVSSWTAALLIAGLIGGLWFIRASDSTWGAVALVTVLGLTGVVGIMWQQSRARATRRWQAALASYAEEEIRKQQRRTARLRKNAA